MCYNVDMKNDNDFDYFTGFVAMINDNETASCRGCFGTFLAMVVVIASFLLVIGSCN